MRNFWIFVIVVTLFSLVIGSLFYIGYRTAKYVDKSGGLKGVTQRVWEGKPQE